MLRYNDANADMYMAKPFSEQTAQLIDKKIIGIVRDAYTKAVKLIKKNKALIEQIA